MPGSWGRARPALSAEVRGLNLVCRHRSLAASEQAHSPAQGSAFRVQELGAEVRGKATPERGDKRGRPTETARGRGACRTVSLIPSFPPEPQGSGVVLP